MGLPFFHEVGRKSRNVMYTYMVNENKKLELYSFHMANNDPTVFKNPEEFDWKRYNVLNQTMTWNEFSSEHSCPGKKFALTVSSLLLQKICNSNLSFKNT